LQPTKLAVNFISRIEQKKNGLLILTISEPITSILFQICIGGIGGFLIGYAMRKLLKVALIICVVIFSLIFLAYINVIKVDYIGLAETVSNIVNAVNPALNIFTPLLAHTPFIASLILGLIIGFKKE
jgi:uncharacterized membrane protein (Fun14 family)